MAPSQSKKSPSSASVGRNGNSIGATSKKHNQSQQQKSTSNGTQESRDTARQVDRFGFITNMDSRGNLLRNTNEDDEDRQADKRFDDNYDKVPTFQEYQKTQRRERKWGNMMNRWNVPSQRLVKGQANSTAGKQKNRLQKQPSNQRIQQGGNTKTIRRKGSNLQASSHVVKKSGFAHRRKVITRLRKGVPDHLRGQAWQWLARVPQKMKQHPGLYQKLVRRAIDEHEEATSYSEEQMQIQKRENGTTSFVSTEAAPTDTKRPPLSPSVAKEAKIFKNIQDTIERDIHRTYPRHHLFYESETSEHDDHDDDGEITSSLFEQSESEAGDFDDDGEHKGGDHVPPFLSKNPALRRSHSPSEMGGRRPLGHPSINDEDDVSGNRSPGFCGNDEISEMIRELEGVVGSPSPPPNQSNSFDFSDKFKSNDQKKNSLPKGFSSAAPSAEVVAERIATDTGGQASLRRVLKAYSVYDREVGYCQGMNFIAGMFLTIMPEEEAFWLLVSVMNEQPCRMRGLFGEGMKETHLVLHVAEKLIQHFLPKLFRHLEKEHVHVTMFATQWLLTQYTSSFRFDLVTRAWDSFLGEGWKVTYRVMLAILKVHESAILKLSFEDILALFRDLPERIQGSVIMRVAMEIPLKRSHILRYESEYHSIQSKQGQEWQPSTPPRKVPSRPKKAPAPSKGRIKASG